MVKNALSQSDSKILKSAISQEKIEESIWFMECSYKFKKHKRWFVNFWLEEVKNTLGHLNCRILESTISQVRID